MGTTEGTIMTVNGTTNKNIDARNLTLPALTILSLVGFVIWATYVATSQIAINSTKLEQIDIGLRDVREKIKTISEEGQRNHYLTSQDINVFCLRAQLVNKDWRCPSIDGYNSLNRYNDSDIIRELQRLNSDDKSPKLNQNGMNNPKEAIQIPKL